MRKRFIGYLTRPEESVSAHHFEAEGQAPFLKFPNGVTAFWEVSSPVEIEASASLLRTQKLPTTFGKGTFRVTPFTTCETRVEYERPLYLLNYSKLADTLANRYEFEVWLRPRWRANLWPYLFRHYLRTGEWPTRTKDYARFFRHILRQSDIAEITRSESETLVKRARKRLAATALTRFGGNRSARILALENAEEMVRKIIGSECFSEMLAEMEMFRSIKRRRSIVPLAGEYFEDETRLKVPFEMAPAKRIVISGPCTVEFMWEYGERFGSPRLCSTIELDPVTLPVLARQVTVAAPRVQIPLDSGVKKGYGVRFKAPLICKGEDARISISDSDRGPVVQAKRHLKGLIPRRSASANTDVTNLRVKVSATET